MVAQRTLCLQPVLKSVIGRQHTRSFCPKQGNNTSGLQQPDNGGVYKVQKKGRKDTVDAVI
jgi:hypothetical protein